MTDEKCIPIGKVREVVQEETADLRDELQEEKEKRRELEKENQILKTRVDSLTDEKDRLADSIGELQSRELEKSAHLKWNNIQYSIDHEVLTVDGGRVERVDGDDGEEYARLPGEADPLERSGESVLSTGDLLPIQQLAQMDDDTLASATSKRSDYIAAKLWQARGQHSPGSVWSAGGPDVREFVDASDVRVFIKSELERADESLSYDYAKKLAGEALERTQELAKNRGYVQRRNHRKDGLSYKERRFVLPADAEIPGESSTRDAPGTDGVTG